jgi:hypothetical protein
MEVLCDEYEALNTRARSLLEGIRECRVRIIGEDAEKGQAVTEAPMPMGGHLGRLSGIKAELGVNLRMAQEEVDRIIGHVG